MHRNTTAAIISSKHSFLSLYHYYILDVTFLHLKSHKIPVTQMLSSKLSFITINALLLISASARADKILFDTCPEDTSGIVSSVDISPCERSNANEACRFRFGEEYTITSRSAVSGF